MQKISRLWQIGTHYCLFVGISNLKAQDQPETKENLTLQHNLYNVLLKSVRVYSFTLSTMQKYRHEQIFVIYQKIFF